MVTLEEIEGRYCGAVDDIPAVEFKSDEERTQFLEAIHEQLSLEDIVEILNQRKV